MDILKQIKKLKYEKDRIKYLKQVISNIGDIEESENCIICNVKQELLDKNAKKVFYQLHCNGMNTVNDKLRELVDYFKLDKPVYYIFDGIHFDTVVNISSLFSNIIFRNCTFDTGIRIFFADNITLENNKYSCWTNFKDYGNAFLWGKVKNLTIKNEKFINNNFYDRFEDNNFGINIEVDKINIDNSDVFARNHGQINIKAKETNIYNSRLGAPEIYLDSDSITFDKGLLRTKNGNIIVGKNSLKAYGVIIENKNCDFDTEMISHNMDSPYVVYNGDEIINEIKDNEQKRLTMVLKNVINKCNQNTLVKSASVKEEN